MQRLKLNRLPDEYRLARIEAEKKGDATYKGRPCKKGHDGTRYLKGGCVECGTTRASQRYHEGVSSPKPNPTAQKSWRLKNREQTLWLGAKHRAQKNGREFAIEASDISIPDLCPVFGTPMVSPSLDRIDNNGGYVRGNISVISKRANTIKGAATLEELEAVVDYMRRNLATVSPSSGEPDPDPASERLTTVSRPNDSADGEPAREGGRRNTKTAQ